MAFQVPTFNLICNIWRTNGVGQAYAAPNVISACNLSPGRRVMVASSGIILNAPMELLLPALTDIRYQWNGGVSDLVEVPSGSKRFYNVGRVDDVGKGFPNEYRLAYIGYSVNGDANLAGGPFPAPVPLP